MGTHTMELSLPTHHKKTDKIHFSLVNSADEIIFSSKPNKLLPQSIQIVHFTKVQFYKGNSLIGENNLIRNLRCPETYGVEKFDKAAPTIFHIQPFTKFNATKSLKWCFT